MTLTPVPVPAICADANCGSFFWAATAFSMEDGATLTFEDGAQVGPCQNCGGLGQVFPGVYTVVNTRATYLPAAGTDTSMLGAVLDIVQRGIRDGISTDVVAETVQRQFPELRPLWDLIPTTKEQAYNFWLLVTAVLGVAIAAAQSCRQDTPTQLLLPVGIVEAIRAAPQRPPSDSRSESPRPPSAPLAE